jgi:hypothetical protein
LETIPAVGAELYLDNSWRRYAHRTEIYQDVNDVPRKEQTRLLFAVARERDNTAPLPKATLTNTPRKKGARREATATEQRISAEQFAQTKLDERKSRSEENDVRDFICVGKQKDGNTPRADGFSTLK